MKFVTYIYNGKKTPGIMSEDLNSVHALSALETEYDSLLSFIKNHTAADMDALNELSKNQGMPVEEVKLIAPIPNPDHNIICVGLNYMDHVAESPTNETERKEAVYFSKYVTEAVGPEGDIDSHKEILKGLDYEAELAVVIGKDANKISREDAWSHVFGLAAFNDVSGRDQQFRHQQWFFGKSLDTFTVMGPWIVSADEFSWPLDLGIQCRVNGETRQNNRTTNMIFPVDYVISELSEGLTLEAGVIIATGTPSGVGLANENYLKPGDIVEVEVEGCGLLRNFIE